MGPLSKIWKAASNARSTAAPDHLSLLSSQFKPCFVAYNWTATRTISVTVPASVMKANGDAW